MIYNEKMLISWMKIRQNYLQNGIMEEGSNNERHQHAHVQLHAWK
jgi:hypothetical protein